MQKKQQFMLVLHGPSCAGKTTIVEHFIRMRTNVFYAWRDKIKWLISDYTAEKHRDITSEMMLAAIEIALKNSLSIIQDQGITTAFRQQYEDVIKKYGVTLLEVNIEASFETISKRFTERLKAVKKGEKISMTDPLLMKQLYEEYLKNKNERFLTIATDAKNPEEIVTLLFDLITRETEKES